MKLIDRIGDRKTEVMILWRLWDVSRCLQEYEGGKENLGWAEAFYEPSKGAVEIYIHFTILPDPFDTHSGRLP